MSASKNWSGFPLSMMLSRSRFRIFPKRFLPGSFFLPVFTSSDHSVTPAAHFLSRVHSINRLPSVLTSFRR